MFCLRFWYETGDERLRFTEDQLAEIRGSSLSGLLCRNCDTPGSLPSSSLDNMKQDTNTMTNCRDLNHLNLEMWREE